jgi:hypothetical protein
VGIPIRIYDFPVSSNVCVHTNQAYVAWMTIENETAILKLSQMDLTSGSITTRSVGVGFGNSSVSIAALNDSLLIAHHRFGGIAYKYVPLKKAFPIDRSEQAGAGQPATAPESKPEGGEKPKLEPKPAPR